MTPDSMDLVSLVAALNDSAIELMKVGAYEGANTLFVDALLILETTKSVTTLSTSGIDGVDAFTQMNPLHFACAPICPTSPQSAGGRITPCTGATATALSSALSIDRRQYRLEVASAGSTASRRISSRTFTRAEARTRTQQVPSSLHSLTVRLPEPENSKQQQTAIYSRAFRIPTKEQQQQQQQQPDEGVISPRIATAVLAFNAALCAHLQSVATGDTTIAPHRALCLYSTAYSIVLMEQQKQQTLDWLLLTAGTSHSSLLLQDHGSSAFCEQTTTSRLVVLLQAALCHNMAAIHGDCFWNFAQARWLRCQLAAAIHWTAFSQMETDDCKLLITKVDAFFVESCEFRFRCASHNSILDLTTPYHPCTELFFLVVMPAQLSFFIWEFSSR